MVFINGKYIERAVLYFRCDRIMMEFLGEIKANAKQDSNSVSTPLPPTSSLPIPANKTEIEFSEMINILIMHSQSHHVTLQVRKFRLESNFRKGV